MAEPSQPSVTSCVDRATLILLACSLLFGCGRSSPQPGQWVHCSCPYLTDYDDRAIHQVEVCVSSPSIAPPLAEQCASRHQPGHFDTCVCSTIKGPCDGTQSCRSLESP